MTEHLERIKHKGLLTPSYQPSNVSKNAPVREGNVGNKGTAQEKRKAREKESRTARDDTGQGSTFGGFQRGFLFGSKPLKSVSKSKHTTASRTVVDATTTPIQAKTNNPQGVQSATADDVIRPKQQDSKSSDLEFPEVQEAMKNSYPFLNTESK